MIGDFQFARAFKDVTSEFLEETKTMRRPETITPEESAKTNKHSERAASRDVWCFAKCVQSILSLFNESQAQKQEKANASNSVNRSRPVDYERQFLSDMSVRKWMESASDKNPVKRSTCDAFSKLSIFREPFCETMLFFDDIRMVPNQDKAQFFRNLHLKIASVSYPILKKRVIPRMLTLPFLSEMNVSLFLPHLFAPKMNNKTSNNNTVSGILEEEDYKQLIVPFITKSYHSNHLALRIRMLQQLQYYIQFFERGHFIKLILPNILMGLSDSNDDLVRFTMDALVQIARHLSSVDKKEGTNLVETVVNRYIEIIHHYAVSNNSIAIRSHAIMSLIELWSIPKIQKSIIFSALHYAIFDTEYEIKLYALNVVLIHMHRFDPREFVSLILKNIFPLALHEKAEVRHKATQVIKSTLDYIEEYDISSCNFGMVSRNDDPSKYVIQAYFPPSSKLPLDRKSQFTGSAPNVDFGLSNGIADTKSVEDGEMENENGRAVARTQPIDQHLVNEVKATTVEQPHSDVEENGDVSENEDNWDKWDEDEEEDEEENDNKEMAVHSIAPVVIERNVHENKEKNVKAISKMEDDDDDDTNANMPDYFSEFGMGEEVVTVKKPAKAIIAPKASPRVSVTKSPPPKEQKSQKSSPLKQKEEVVSKPLAQLEEVVENVVRPEDTEIHYNDTSMDDVDVEGWDDDLDIDISDVAIGAPVEQEDQDTYTHNEVQEETTAPEESKQEEEVAPTIEEQPTISPPAPKSRKKSD